MHKKLILLILPVFILSLSFISVSRIFAQTPSVTAVSPTPTIVISDYAKDVKNGEQGIANDQNAQNNQKDVNENETVEAQEETDPAEAKEAIEPAEAVEPQEAVEVPESEGGVEQKGESGASEGSKSSGELPSGTNGSAGSTGENK